MSFPAYPEYKDSQVDWLENLPAGWMRSRLKFAAEGAITNGVGEASDRDDPDDPRYIRITDLAGPRKLRSDTFRSLPKEIASKASVSVNDLLLAAVGATFGKSYLHTEDIGPACYAGYLVKVTPNASQDPRFIAYWTESAPYWHQLNSQVIQSTVQNFSASRYKELLIDLPPLSEQHVIAAFLDRETAKVDAAVAAQERLIALLAEKRAATISHAVTKGLNPDAPMKDSGIEWLGQIPAHWAFDKLQYFCEFDSGKAHEPFFDTEGNIICATARFVSTGGKANRFCTQNVTPAQPGDILMVMSDLPNGRALARAYLVTQNDSEIAVNQRVARIRPIKGNSAYLAAQLNRHEELLRYNDGMNQTHLSNDAYRKLRLLFPPIEEQNAIAEYVTEQKLRFDELSQAAEAAIQLLKERRAALISAAVTGKIDVRSEVELEAQEAA